MSKEHMAATAGAASTGEDLPTTAQVKSGNNDQENIPSHDSHQEPNTLTTFFDEMRECAQDGEAKDKLESSKVALEVEDNVAQSIEGDSSTPTAESLKSKRKHEDNEEDGHSVTCISDNGKAAKHEHGEECHTNGCSGSPGASTPVSVKTPSTWL